ncbi:MAG: flippase [Parcubacteria group bacterium]|nr:flippase [Parcubacteria group bacterium]
MSLTNKIAKNTIFQMSGKIFGSVFALIAIALITRYLGPEGFGIYATILAFLQIFGILVDLGLTLVTVQMISEKDAPIKQFLDNIFTFRVVTAFVFLSIAPLIVIFFPYPQIVKIGVMVGAAAFFFNALNQILICLFQKELKMGKVAWAEILNRLVFLILIATAIIFKFNLIAFVTAMVIGNFINFVALFIYSRRLIKISFKFEFNIWKKIILRSWPIAAGIALNLIYLRADIFILSLLKPAGDVGLYGAPYKIIDFLTALPYMFMGLALPILTLMWSEKNLPRFKRISQKSFDALMIFVVPVVLGGMVLAEPLMLLFAGKDFAGSGMILQILLIAVGLIFPTTLFTHAVIAIKKQKLMLWGFGISAILSLTGYLVFIPRYSYIGAAWVTVFSEGLILLFSMAVILKFTGFLPSSKITSKSLFASLVMASLVIVSPIQNLFFLIPAGALVYLVILFITKGVTREMIKSIASLR